MRGHRCYRQILLLAAAVWPIVGCALPDYHLPRGFSSSYYRHLQGPQPLLVAPTTVPPAGVPQDRMPPSMTVPQLEQPRSYTPPPQPGL